jgi:alpha-beta hydrolase superfamily lysophospholipase
MKHTEFTLISGDGLRLYGQIWEPEQVPKAALSLCHGLGEHSGRYRQVAEFLGRYGYTVLAVDLRGHGKSQGRRGHIPSYALVMEDIDAQLKETTRRFPGLPTFLYGHSLGGAFVLNYALRWRPSLAGVIATGPGLRPAFTPPGWKVRLAKALYHIWPALSMNNEVDRRMLSRDPDVVRAYEADPLVHDRLSPRLGIDLLQAGEWAVEHAKGCPLPILIMHGGADGLTSASASQQFAKAAGDLCTFKIWPGLFHEIHNEPERNDVLMFMVGWLEKVRT